jgi:hypothetical protein
MSSQFNLDNLDKEYVDKLKIIWDTDYSTIKSGKDNKGVPFLKYIFELHFKIFGKTCSNCPGEISGYITKLKKLNTTLKMETKTVSNFRLADDTTSIPILGTSLAYSNANFTDEVAIELLSQNKKRLALFSRVPENLEELLAAYAQKQDAPKKLNVVKDNDPEFVKIGDNLLFLEQAHEIIKKQGLTTQAKTVQGVQNYFDSRAENVKNEIIVLADAIKDQSLTGDQNLTGNQTDEFEGMDKESLGFELDKAKQEHQDLVDDILKYPNPQELETLALRIEALKNKLGIVE